MKLQKGIDNLSLVFALSLAMFIVYFISTFTNLIQFGIFPGNVHTLPHIFSAPFIHGSWMHLINNTLGFWVFSLLCLLRGRVFYIRASLFIITVSGLLVWLFARKALHIGASGWIFGLWSLAIANAYFQKQLMSFVIAILVVFFYGGMIWGLLPLNAMVSFEGHIFGAISGVAAAYTFRKVNR